FILATEDRTAIRQLATNFLRSIEDLFSAMRDHIRESRRDTFDRVANALNDYRQLIRQVRRALKLEENGRSANVDFPVSATTVNRHTPNEENRQSANAAVPIGATALNGHAPNDMPKPQNLKNKGGRKRIKDTDVILAVWSAAQRQDVQRRGTKVDHKA